MKNKQLVIIGGGPAGLAAAVSAYDNGVRDILVLEREPILGGILNQCIHNGFGLHRFKEELTGPEYAARFIKMAEDRDIDVLTSTAVINLSKNKVITAVSESEGLLVINADAVIIAAGCRERSRGTISIPGDRCAGIFSAGTAQKLVNMKGYMPGKETVILGSGDIGLIMARRMIFEGAKVKAVIELMPYSGGLNRNIVQCLNDFDIPLKLSHTITKITGQRRIESVTVSQVDKNLKPIAGTEEVIKCDNLLLSVGLLPENEVSRQAEIPLSKVTGGASVDENMMTERDGIFACGNVLHVHDLVDFVSEESETAGRAAAQYLISKENKAVDCTDVTVSDGIRYSVPQRINKLGTGDINFKMRVANPQKNVRIIIAADGEILVSKLKKIVTPGEMETISLNKDKSQKLRNASEIKIFMTGGAL